MLYNILFCLSSGDTYISLCIYLTASELFCCEVFKTFGISSAILLPVKSPVASAVFEITFCEVVLRASVTEFLA